jgi:hypothetical protein
MELSGIGVRGVRWDQVMGAALARVAGWRTRGKVALRIG